jgi:C4-dicarboxylate-binding protein DctP
MTQKIRFLLSLVLLALMLHSKASAQQVINMTMVSGYAPVATWIREIRDFYIPEINKRLAASGKFKINWNQAYSGQLANVGGELQAIQKGLADIGVVVIPLATDKIGLYAVSYYTPFVSNDVVVISKTIDKMAKKFPEMAKQWEQFNQINLVTIGVVDTYQVLSKKPIKSPDDFKGMKIGGVGPNLLWLQSMGATGVVAPMNEAYNALQTGVIDGYFIHSGAAKNVKLNEVAPFHVSTQAGGASAFAVSINSNTWKKLPDEVKNVFLEVSRIYPDYLGKAARIDNDDGIQAYKDSKGTFVTIGDDVRIRWAKSMPNIAQKWAEDQEKQGYPGKAVLKAYMDEMRVAKQPVMRNWDTE